LNLDLRFLLEFEFLRFKGVVIKFIIYFDCISLLFFRIVSLISCSVIFYRGRYINNDKNIYRFIWLVNLFVISMFFLVFRLNIIRILLGWDGLGLVSYILVIYYRSEKSNRAGIITALSNRVGDAAILVSIGAMMEIGRWDFMLFNESSPEKIIWGALIVLAAITKRAQIPFSAWLPAAIAAPTPVRALVHSSTLVTAGVYLIIRFYPLLKEVFIFKILFYIGLATTFIARRRAMFEKI